MQSLLLADKPLFGTYDTGIYVFGLSVQYYALVIVCGMILAAILCALMMKRRNMDSGFIFLLFICCIPTAIIGARLFSCLTDPQLGIGAFFQFPWAGLSITGGVIGGVVAGLIVCLICKVDFFRAADCIVINILLAQAIGRWGNYFNQEVYGGLVTDPALQWFPFAVQIGGESGEWHYAFFFYEMVLNVIGWAILFTFTWFRKKKPNGISACLYFVWYGTVRAFMEPFRDTEFILAGGGVMWSELFAILMAGGGIIGILVLMLLNYKKEGAFIGSRTGDPCGITKFLSNDKKAQPYFSKINMMGADYPPAPPKEKKGKGHAERGEASHHTKSESQEDSSVASLPQNDPPAQTERPKPAPLGGKKQDGDQK